MFHHRPTAALDLTMDRLIEMTVVVVLAAMLLVVIPLMARVPAATDLEPRPRPAPPPVAAVDFPEHARVDGACRAMLSKSAAVDNERAPRAATITSVLLQDACFGA